MNQGTYIENTEKNYHSYTFQIYNDENNYNINNIVLSSHNNEPYRAYLVIYNLTEEERNIIERGVDIPLEDKTVIQYFDIEQISLSNRGSTCYDLVQVDTVEDCAAGHDVSNCSTDCCGGCYDGVYEWVEVDCGGGGGGSGTTGSGSGSGTTSGGGGSTDGSGSDSDDSSLATSLTSEKCLTGPDITTALSGTGISLSAEQLSCITERGNCSTGSTLISFITANSLETAFFYKAVSALCNGGDVDVAKRIVFNIPNDCHEKIIKEAFNNTSDLTQHVKDVFEGTNTYYVYEINQGVITNDQFNNPRGGATTGLPTGDYNCVITTTINTWLLSGGDPSRDEWEGATDLSIAKTVIHESLHALLVYLLDNGDLNSSFPNPTYVQLAEAFAHHQAVNNQESGQALNVLQHEYMVSFVNAVATALQQVGQNLGYNNPYSYYQKLAWSGSLESSQSYPIHFTALDEYKARAIGISELFNINTIYQGVDADGNAMDYHNTPKGKLANSSNSNCN
ncbi:hypothetical protein [Pseudofulvibacter geojedonensis]|uniref:Uncharacterized protein n=1 Tax=Pseudofulvibacter geojedonensis TaxID=1123758 RepID=A0ABW3I480_9FLAO